VVLLLRVLMPMLAEVLVLVPPMGSTLLMPASAEV
jgi:hypothetical protein